MTDGDFIWTIAILVALATVLAFAIKKMIFAIRHHNEDPVPQKIHEASHELRNEVTKLQAGVHRTVNSPNPFAELVARLEAARDRNGGRA